jgi:hypothetical protein
MHLHGQKIWFIPLFLFYFHSFIGSFVQNPSIHTKLLHIFFKWVGKTLTQLQETIPKEWLWILDEIHQLIDFLPPDGSRSLYALWKQLPGHRSSRSALEQLRDLLLRLSQDWHTYCTFQSEPQIPRTHNPTEQVIGRQNGDAHAHHARL